MAELTQMADRIYDLAEPGLRKSAPVRSLQIIWRKRDFRSSVGSQVFRPPSVLSMNREKEDLPLDSWQSTTHWKGIGHACGHHQQGPSVIGAALALRDLCKDQPYKIVIYGTPAEETVGGKIIMKWRKGAFRYRSCAHDACSPQYLCRCPLYGP